jgi:hypothetical protein
MSRGDADRDPRPSVHARAWRWLAGDEAPGRPALPISELLAPVPLLAALILTGNVWLLKPSSAPGWLTGKLSDVAGLVVAPLLLTALVDLALHAAARLGARVDDTLRAWKLAAAIALVAIGFAATKLWPAAADLVAGALASLLGRAAIVADPTDLAALPALAIAAWQGRAALARGAAGRLAWAARTGATAPYADAVRAGADPAAVDALHAAIAGGDPAAVTAGLHRLRS